MITAPSCSYMSTQSTSKGSVMVNASFYKPFDPYTGGSSYWQSQMEFVYVNPFQSKFLDDFSDFAIEKWQKRKGFKGTIKTKSFLNEQGLESYINFRLNNGSYSISSLIGTVFNSFTAKEELPDSLDYKIRFGVFYNSFNLDQKYRSYNPTGSYSEYTDTNFLSWQSAVEESFIERKAEEKKKKLNYNITMQQFPFPEHFKQDYTMAQIIPSFVFYGFIFFIINLLRRVIEEKTNGSKELFKMMGMKDYIYWISTFLNYFIIAVITAVFIAILYKIPLGESCKVLNHANGLLLFLSLVFFLIMLILYSMVFTIFFNRAIYGFIVLIIITNITFQVTWIQVFLQGMNYLPLSPFVKFAICLLPHGGLLSFMYFFNFFESIGTGASWSNLSSFSVVSDFNLLMVYGSMLVGCVLYIFLIWYFDKVWPWQKGVPQPFYFFCLKSYWCGNGNHEEADEIQLMNQEQSTSADFFEAEPTGISAGIVIQNLSKEFQSKSAVKNLSLNIYQGQITALLGHNGAGKTTTINILTGLFPPSSGNAFVNGCSVQTDIEKARRGIGVCPQHNVLFDTLTVEEHLKIYAALKGVPWSQLTTEADKILSLLNLTLKKKELIKNISGGMKRKLCMGIAIIGGSKVLFLDEPTSGMDVEARRSVWDTLRDIRHDRTIILTTHYMEEADILGDRIAIMAEGEVQCCGAPIFLKNKFGTGYHLHVVKDLHFNHGGLLSLLKKFVPEVMVGNEIEKEIAFNLSASDSNFGDMFEELERHKTEIGVMSYGLTVTTMEDVFLKVASLSETKYKKTDQIEVNNDRVPRQTSNVFGETTRIERRADPKNVILAFLIKRMHYAKRQWGILALQVIIPFLMICMTFYIMNLALSSSNSNALKLDIKEVYGETMGFYSQSNDQSQLSKNFKDVLESNSVKVNKLDDPTKFILDFGKQNYAKYLQKFPVGGTINESTPQLNLTAWFNGFTIHALPMSLLMMNNALLKYATGSGSITLTNSPIQSKGYYGKESTLFMSRMLAGVFMPLALVLVSAAFVLLPTHERVSKAKLLQLMSGAPASVYWISMFMWDYVVYFVITLILLIPFAIFGHVEFFAHHSVSIGAVLMMMWLYGWSAIPFTYLFSKLFNKGNTGYSILITIGIVFGTSAVSIMASFGVLTDYVKQVEPIIWIFRFLPNFSVGAGFSNLFALSYSNAYCDGISADDLAAACTKKDSFNPLFRCCKGICGKQCLQEISPFTWERSGCGRDMLFLAIDGILYFSLLLFLETQIMASFARLAGNNIRRLLRRGPVVQIQFVRQQSVVDSDVLVEADRIRNTQVYGNSSGSEALLVTNLSKMFRNFYAVDHLSFSIHPEECFGLLGVNGAGKTTTFRMLVGDCYPNEGNAFIKQHSIRTDLRRFQAHLGYCPQFDALIDRLTGRETLTLFGRLRGLSGAILNNQVDNLIAMTDLEAHADKQTRFYSGGNKRKLSVGMSLIGSPKLILLDEPTAGVDPVSRRKIWNVLAQARRNMGSAVLLTTHSMEESEALCSRLAIMVNGQFKCLGSIQQLKSKYGQGYTLIVKLSRSNQDDAEFVNQVKEHIRSNVNGAELKDDHQGMLQYHIVDKSITLSYLFKFMAVMKAQFQLEDYLISDTSLEQIFLTFARSQRISA